MTNQYVISKYSNCETWIVAILACCWPDLTLKALRFKWGIFFKLTPHKATCQFKFYFKKWKLIACLVFWPIELWLCSGEIGFVILEIENIFFQNNNQTGSIIFSKLNYFTKNDFNSFPFNSKKNICFFK